MTLLDRLAKIWIGTDHPFLVHQEAELRFSDIASCSTIDLSLVTPGDVVALIGDFDPPSILTLLRLMDKATIVVPLTAQTANQHEYFFESSLVDVIISNGCVTRRSHSQSNRLIDSLREEHQGGLVLFTTGTTGAPKAILHRLPTFLKRFDAPRPALRMISFLLFDHIGGLNTLFHALFNRGGVVAPRARTVGSVLETCRRYSVEVLPTTPTFLRLMLMSGAIPNRFPSSVRVVSYGTERMDQSTLSDLCKLLPAVDFRQTYGMSELGILRVRSEARDSLFMEIGGEGIETRVAEGAVLHIRSESRMMGYLNAPSPFDYEGWYDTKDVVEVKGKYCKIVGRVNDVINVGGLKFMASEVECAAMRFPSVSFVKVLAKSNPLTGQHVEMIAQPSVEGVFDKLAFVAFLKENLQSHMVPKRILVEAVPVSHRFKRN